MHGRMGSRYLFRENGSVRMREGRQAARREGELMVEEQELVGIV